MKGATRATSRLGKSTRYAKPREPPDRTTTNAINAQLIANGTNSFLSMEYSSINALFETGVRKELRVPFQLRIVREARRPLGKTGLTPRGDRRYHRERAKRRGRKRERRRKPNLPPR